MSTVPPPAVLKRHKWLSQGRVSPQMRRLQQQTSLLVLALLGIICLYGFVYSRTVSYELLLNQRQKEIKRLKEQDALLRARVVQVQSAARIDQRVSQVLRMQLPDRIEYVPVPRTALPRDDRAPDASTGAPVQAPLGF